jgi:hypothetical protein
MTSLATRAGGLLGSRSTFRMLLLLNVLVTLGMMWTTRSVMLSDAWSYIALAEGITQGSYSMWWPLGDGYPDTFRTPGFPLLIAFAMTVFGSWKAMVWVNLAFYLAALWFTLRVVERLDPRLEVRSLFLVLLLPMVNIPYYIGQVYTEIPVLAFVSASLYLLVGRTHWRWHHGLVLGLLFAGIFQMKPVFLYFPLLYVVVDRLAGRDRSRMVPHVVMLGTYVLLLLPYGFWNQRHHGVFKLTPLEGAGSYMHFANWCGKFPGYTERVYWHNFAGDELVRFVPEEEIPLHIEAYEREWEGINERIRPLLTAEDSIMLNARDQVAYGVVNTYNTRFTLERERLLVEKSIEHMLSDPWYMIRYKAYTAVRTWVIGIQVGEFRSASMAGKLKMLYATLSTGIMFLLFVVLVPLALFRKLLRAADVWPLLAYMAYFTIIYLPFTIQARYSTPVRFAMLALIALAAWKLFAGREAQRDRSIAVPAASR